MNLKSGYIDLFPLVFFATVHPLIPGGTNPGIGRYSRRVTELTKGIPQLSGWYCWGCFDAHGNWKTTYVGKAEMTHATSLQYRLSYELEKERICFWASVVGDWKAFQDHHKAFHGRFDGSARRALRKKGAQYILWASMDFLPTSEILNIEQALIRYYKPVANVHLIRDEVAMNGLSKEVARAFSSEQKKILKQGQD